MKKKEKAPSPHSRELATLQHLEKIMKACANRHRLKIIQTLMRGEYSVGEIAGKIKIHPKTASRHLRILASVDLVEWVRRQHEVMYKLSGHHVQLLEPILYILEFARKRE